LLIQGITVGSAGSLFRRRQLTVAIKVKTPEFLLSSPVFLPGGRGFIFALPLPIGRTRLDVPANLRFVLVLEPALANLPQQRRFAYTGAAANRAVEFSLFPVGLFRSGRTLGSRNSCRGKRGRT
jgi:hypothetical protein